MSALPTFSFHTTAEEVADVFANEIRGKNVLVTGTSLNGLGFETARVLAKYANLVIITGYNQERLKLSEYTIKKENPAVKIYPLTLDLSSFASIRKAAAEVNALEGPLHSKWLSVQFQVLIHNAAAFGTSASFTPTIDGVETQYATNHVGPFLLSKLLAPKLLASATAGYTPRVVYLSSVAHGYGTGVDFDLLTNPKAEGYDAFKTYWATKSTAPLMAIELSKRSKGKINAFSLEPGRELFLSNSYFRLLTCETVIFTASMENEVVSTIMKGTGALTPEGKPAEGLPWKTLAEGAATTVAAAFDTRLNDQAGAYLADSNVANDKRAAHSSDPDDAERLWTVTEKIIGEKFTF
ncbi:short-chain dehydrogenase/reductase family protein [Favolaschia claudopus]|uniref:Short-chain dehydrogenase/reductase family protein n=1 Tax=Favolaschia claudopus TaxID=2862362 RepID=A0AAW0BW09_9AGAR